MVFTLKLSKGFLKKLMNIQFKEVKQRRFKMKKQSFFEKYLKISFSLKENKPTIRIVFWKIGIVINLFWV